MDIESIIIISIIIFGVFILYNGWLIYEQSGGASIAPGVYDQLNNSGPMNTYLTGDYNKDEIIPYYTSYGPPFFYPKYFNGPPYKYGSPYYYQAPFF